MSAFVCGGTPSPDDLAKVQEFEAALALPTRHLTQLALLEMDDSGVPEVAEALASHKIDGYPWVHPNGGRIPTRYGGAPGDTFDPHPGFCRHRECYGLEPDA